MSILDSLSDTGSLSQYGTTLQVGGQMMGAVGQLIFGNQQKQSADFLAAQLRQQAGDVAAAAQRRAFLEDRNAKYVQSATLAAAAASGGGASDPTVINLIAQTAAEGAYRQQTALYQGDSKAQALRVQADTSEYDGEAKQAASRMGAITSSVNIAGSLARGMARDASLFQRFGGGGPKAKSMFTESDMDL